MPGLIQLNRTLIELVCALQKNLVLVQKKNHLVWAII